MFSRYFLIILLTLLSSCSSKNLRKKYNYDQTEQNYYPKPYYQQQYPKKPNSRAYSNPYAFPQQYSPPLYDADQYYVPPTQYYNIEKPQTNPASYKY